MCGIVAVSGRREAAPVLLDGLRRLEYRGYDSAGIATVDAGKLARRRSVGKIANLAEMLACEPLPGTIGIGHTRWATHGPATVNNAHPHQAGRVAVVHNGIIENYREIRESLSNKGYIFDSETDTETIAKLCEWHLDEGLDPYHAASKTIEGLAGAFAICFLFDGLEDFLFAVRKGSPLAVGHGDGEIFLASDAKALAPLTSRITFLEEGDRVVAKSSGTEFFDGSGNSVRRREYKMHWAPGIADKDGFDHFMVKEILEQPVALRNAVSKIVDSRTRKVNLPDGLDFTEFDRVALVACGTAHYACSVAKYWFEQYAGMPVDADIASEFRYRSPLIDSRTLAVFVSQSGETADTLAALKYAKANSARTVGVLNDTSSAMARECDAVVPISAGIETSVASTKAFTCQLAVLGILAITAGKQRCFLDDEQAAKYIGHFESVPAFVNQAFAAESAIKRIAGGLRDVRNAIFFGRGTMYPLALEGALKLKEISYIHAEGFAGGELKHGPIALVEKNTPIFVLAPSGPLFEKTASNIEEVKARGGKVYLISDMQGLERTGSAENQAILMPAIEPIIAPIVYAIPVQQLAYHTALVKGTDVDQPRNLAKSVTVE